MLAFYYSPFLLIAMFYWTLLNIHPAHRSTIHSIQLLAIAKSGDIRSHGMDMILAPIIKDLKTLAEQVFCVLSND